MTSYRLKNTTAPKSVKQLVSEVVKNSDTTIIPRSTSFTIDSSDSSSPLEDLSASPTKVRDITEDILRAAKNNYLQVPASKSRSEFGNYKSPESSAPNMKHADENGASLDQSTQLDPVHESNPTTRFSLNEIKAMVLQSIPDNVRTSVPPEQWTTILDEAMETSLSNEIISLQNDPTEEDVKDFVSFLSIYVQRQTRSTPPPPVSSSKKAKARKSKTSAQMLDAMTLILESLSNTAIVENEDGKLVIMKDANDHPPTDHDRRVIPPMPAMPTAVPTSETLQPPQPHSSPSRSITNMIPGYIPKPPTERRIGFSRVQIRYYEQILSDNPSVTKGPPIGIGWKYRVMKQDLSIDAWEYKQQPCRRYLSGLLTSREDRMTWLSHLGYTQREIAESVREVLRVKNNRKQSFNNVKLEGIELAVERTTRRLKNILTLGLASRQEKKLLGPYIKKKK